mmetsp:Transcript_6381/g.6292  ORF Transcript_6381/g.6292 Transcript_6381/m.6292 type:complete len:100 (-) Transcript_6381:22-321(-)
MSNLPILIPTAQNDTVAEWLRRQIRNLLEFLRAGSSPVGVDMHNLSGGQCRLHNFRRRRICILAHGSTWLDATTHLKLRVERSIAAKNKSIIFSKILVL